MMIKIPVRLRDEAILTIKDSKGTRTFKLKNLILDKGLVNLGSYPLQTLITAFGVVKCSVPVGVGNIETDICGPLEYTACGGGQLGVSDWWQNSYIQGAIESTVAADNESVDHDFGILTRHWEVDNSNFVAMSLGHTTGKDEFGNPFAIGGSLVDLTDMILAKRIYKFNGTLDYPCRGPGDPVGEEPYDLQILDNIWNRFQFKDEDGNPTTISIDVTSIIHLNYTIILDVLSTPITDTVTINGVSTTVTTRCYQPLSSWYVTTVFDWGASTAQAWENDAMPTIDMWQTGSNAGVDIVNNISNNPREIKYTWGAAKANFATGIGSVTHGPHSAYISTFNPKITKTNLQKFVFQPIYNVVRVGGD